MRVLAIEDDPIDQRAIQRGMLPEWECSVAPSLAEGMELVSSSNFDCILVDYRLPDGDGLSAIASLKEKDVPIIMLTGEGNEEVAVRALRGGATDYIKKGQISGGLLSRAILQNMEKKTLESELKFAQRELARKEKLNALGTMAAGVAHEMNTPLQYIFNNLEVVTRMLGESEAEETPHRQVILEALSDVTEGCELLRGLVSKLYVNSHPNSNQPKVCHPWICLNKAIELCGSDSSALIRSVSEKVKSCPEVVCRETDLVHVFINLINNAAGAIHSFHGSSAREIGELRFDAEVDGESVFISVQDNGGGIPEEIQGKVFDNFFTTKTVGQGSGQGLFLSYQRVVAVDGMLYFETEIDDGTTFFIRLQRVPKAESAG